MECLSKEKGARGKDRGREKLGTAGLRRKVKLRPNVGVVKYRGKSPEVGKVWAVKPACLGCVESGVVDSVHTTVEPLVVCKYLDNHRVFRNTFTTPARVLRRSTRD